MTAWRAVFTDTESMTGVAPVCDHQNDVQKHSSGDGYGVTADPHGVYDCCPHPHLQVWDERFAQELAANLTDHDVDLCT